MHVLERKGQSHWPSSGPVPASPTVSTWLAAVPGSGASGTAVRIFYSCSAFASAAVGLTSPSSLATSATGSTGFADSTDGEPVLTASMLWGDWRASFVRLVGASFYESWTSD